MANSEPDRVKVISICSSAYNEEQNLPQWYERIKKVFDGLPNYDFEIVVSDNRSTDNTREVMRELAAKDKRFKVIFNANNFGQIRSPYNSFLRGTGDANIMTVTDLQEPPELIVDMIKKWEEGYEVVTAIKSQSEEGFVTLMLRNLYYSLLSKFADSNIDVIQKFTGFGLYDRKFMEALRKIKHPIPYFRGLVSEIGFKRTQVFYTQKERQFGVTKNNVFILYDYAMHGLVNSSRAPLRVCTFFGFIIAALSLFVALIYLIYKLLFWESFRVGMAPVVIGIFFFGAIQLFFIGLIGEYVGSILTHVRKFPLVIEEETINFD